MARESSTMGYTVLAQSSMKTNVHGAEWTVGDRQGWSVGVSGWPNGKPIHAGDVLVFNYDRRKHDVVEVDEGAYNSCNISHGGSRSRFTSGSGHIPVRPGKTFYTCSIPGQCQKGMKIAWQPNEGHQRSPVRP